MDTQQDVRFVNLEQRFAVTRSCIRQLLAVLHGGKPANGEFGEIGDLVKSLPLATDRYALATRHLANADRYLSAGERGAAEYELRLLQGSLLESASISRRGLGRLGA